VACPGIILRGKKQFVDVEIPAGAKQIKLDALQGKDGRASDHADWVNAGFILK